jgi:tetratricopeptide (TPR) repeat protein
VSTLRKADTLYVKGDAAIERGLNLFDLERANIEAGQAWAARNWDRNLEAASVCQEYALVGRNILGLRLRAVVLIRWLEVALLAARRSNQRQAAGDCLTGLGLAHSRLGETERAIERHERALRIAKEMNDKKGEEISLGNLGSAYESLGDYRGAIELHEQALKIAREIGYLRGEGANLSNLGNAHAALGDRRTAISYYEQALAISLELLHKWSRGRYVC